MHSPTAIDNETISVENLNKMGTMDIHRLPSIRNIKKHKIRTKIPWKHLQEDLG